MRFNAYFLASCSLILACHASPAPIFRRANNSTSILSAASGSTASTKSSFEPALNTTTMVSSSSAKPSSVTITSTSEPAASSSALPTSSDSSSSSVPSTSSSSLPITTPPAPTQAPTSSFSSTSTAVATTTVSDGATIIVAAGTVVVGGAQGGFINVGGVVTPIAAGATVTAGQSTGDDSPSQPSNSVDEGTTSQPTSTSESSSSTSQSSSSTSSPAETPTAAIIFPVDTAADADVTKLLDETLGTGNYVTSFLAGDGLKFVNANITASQNTTISASTLISSVVPDGPIDDTPTETPNRTGLPRRRNLRSRAVVEQANAVPELKRFSQVPGTAFDSMTGYSYDSSSGTGITVYVIDTGFGTASDEYKNMGGEPPRWLFAASEKADASESDEDENSHGSCAGSKVNGPTYGVVKNANLVIVKAQETLGDTVSAMNEVLADILGKKLVLYLLIMIVFTSSAGIVAFMEKWTAATVKLDVILVLSAGNDDPGVEIDEYPQLLADEYPIINVGAVDETGKNASFSKGGPLVTVMAPGVNIICASGDPSGADQDIDGTSFAAPAVAGLAAYLLALGEYPDLGVTGSVAANMRDLITSMAYPRITDGSPVAYNGEGAVCEGQTSGTAKLRRRQNGGSCKVSSSSSVISSSTAEIPAPTTAPASPTTTAPPAATTTAPPAVTTLFPLDESVAAGTTSCFPTTNFDMSPGTFGFNFDVDSSMLVRIETGSSEGYFQGMGSATGTFYATYSGNLKICATNSGSGALQLKFAITSAPTTPLAAPAGTKVFGLSENVRAGTTSCFPTTGLDIQRKTYGFSYTIADGVVVSIGDSSSNPDYFSGIGSGSGTMFLDFSGGSISICAENTGGSDATLDFTMTE